MSEFEKREGRSEKCTRNSQPPFPLNETLDEDGQDVWENERTPTPVWRFEVRLHAVGLSIRETVAILDLLGVDRSHGAVWNWVHTLSEAQSDPRRRVCWR